MTNRRKSRLAKLFKRYKIIIISWIVISIVLIISSIIIQYSYDPENYRITGIIAKLLMTLGQAGIGVVLVGGGIGGVINFIFEEMKREEEDVKERLKERRGKREKQKLYRNKMQHILQEAIDNVELARVLIKSHKSGRTYGEQIRNRIIPGLIALKDFKRRLMLIDDSPLEKNLDPLQVSVTYMIAYLSVLKEEFEANYLRISNLQNFKDAVVDKLKTDFVENAENVDKIFKDNKVPPNVKIVWEALQDLDYLSDFIGDLRNEEGIKSMYLTFFLQHYYNCNKIIRSQGSDVNQKLTGRKDFISNIKEFNRIEDKKNSDEPLTSKDSLTRRIMIQELKFDFETCKISIS